MREPSIISVLLKYLNNSEPSKVNYTIAEGLLKNFEKVSTTSIHSMAQLCFVSSSSLSRFVKKIGFHSYIEFKEKCQDEINIEVDYSSKIKKATSNELSSIFRYYTTNIIENVEYNFDLLKYEELLEICQLIHDAPDVAFFGLEFANVIGLHLQIKLAECNRFVQLKRNGSKDIELAQNLSENSVAIIASLEGGYFYRHEEVIKELKKKNIKIISITMQHNSKLFRDVDYFMFCNKHNSETEGRISLLHMIEILIMTYYINYKY